MSNQDDVKLRIGLDLDALKVDTEKAGDMVGKVLGTGKTASTAATKSPAQSFVEEMERLLAVSKDTQRVYEEMTKAMREQVALREKEFNFKREESRMPGGGGSGGTGRGAGGTGFFSGASGLVGMRTGGENAHNIATASRIGDAARTAGRVTEDWLEVGNRGWRSTEIAGAAARTIDSIPVLGRILGGYSSALESVSRAGQSQDQWREARYQSWLAGGESGRAGFTNLWDYSGGRSVMRRYGIDRDESLHMELAAQRAYGGGAGVQYAVQGRFGLGNEQTQLMGALRRAGSSNGGELVFAETIGTALATQLERGRWGEAFSTLTRAAQGVLYGNADLQKLVAVQTLVGQLGRTYQGDTPQAQSMASMLERWSSGQGGSFVNVMALQQTLKKTGGDYWAAKAMVEAGVGSDRGMSDEMLKSMIQRMPAARMYFSGQWSLDRSAGILATLIPGESINRIKDLLSGMKAGAGQRTGPTNDAILQDLYNGKMPDTDMGSRRARVGSQMPYSYTVLGQGFDQQSAAPTIADPVRGTPPTSSRMGRSYAWDADALTLPAPSRLDPDQWSSLSQSIQAGATQQQIQANKTDYTPKTFSDYFVADMQEAEGQWATKAAHGLYDDRDRAADGSQLAPGKHRRHGSRDIYMPAGSPVHAPMDGTWVRSGDLGSIASTYGFYGEMRGDDGVLYRFLHLNQKPYFRSGVRITAGQLIGHTAKHKVGRGASHLHLEAWRGDYKKGTQVDPFAEMGIRGVNRMYTGFSSREEYQQSTQPVTSPSMSGSSMPMVESSGAAPANVTPAAIQSQEVKVSVTVHDARISVTQSAGRRNSGAIGQNYNTRGH